MSLTNEKKKVAVYGTLRGMTLGTPIQMDDQITGLVVDLGSYPALVTMETDLLIEVDVVEVDDETLAQLDKYEGVDTGLYHRANTVTLAGHEVIVYKFNRVVSSWKYNEDRNGYPTVEYQNG